ncbi:50S ribosomal protein L33 [Planococcaceae bacterium Storch 2/2-2]|nr:50S ribosomal protein L33 [Planococcaceae bacterium Storch 2/2-2]
MSKKIVLCCDQCGARNYSVPKRNNQNDERLTLKKFCKTCNAHTLHKQT